MNDFVVNHPLEDLRGAAEKGDGSIVFDTGFITRFKNWRDTMNFPVRWDILMP